MNGLKIGAQVTHAGVSPHHGRRRHQYWPCTLKTRGHWRPGSAIDGPRTVNHLGAARGLRRQAVRRPMVNGGGLRSPLGALTYSERIGPRRENHFCDRAISKAAPPPGFERVCRFVRRIYRCRWARRKTLFAEAANANTVNNTEKEGGEPLCSDDVFLRLTLSEIVFMTESSFPGDQVLRNDRPENLTAAAFPDIAPALSRPDTRSPKVNSRTTFPDMATLATNRVARSSLVVRRRVISAIAPRAVIKWFFRCAIGHALHTALRSSRRSGYGGSCSRE